MGTNNWEQYFIKLINTLDKLNSNDKQTTINTIKNTILNIYNFKNNNTNKEVLLPQCVTIIDFLVNNDKTLTKQECIDFQNILSNCSNAVYIKNKELKKQLNNIIIEINNKTIIENDEDYKAFKAAASNKLTEDEIKDMYLKYKSK